MEYEEDIKKLENNIEKMLRGFEISQGEKKQLHAEIARLEEDNRLLKEQLARLAEEKKHVRQRVSGLLGTIEKWEKTSGSANIHGQPTEEQFKVAPEPVQGVLIIGN